MDTDIVTGILVSEQGALSLEEMVEACGTEVEWIVELVEVGVLSPEGPDETAWRFGALDLLRARRLARLERDFAASAEAAAVILDLLDEIERLRACLIRAGVEAV
ncbi:MAG: Chaperone modulatory protein CbpM [Chromatiales bacterium USCg_Taylor]|nr:MAG: Chaperone modulatory protein CbpM [Chromatiales bacterium USCg_Taylor]